MKLSLSVALSIAVVIGGFDLWLWKQYHSPAATLIAVGAFGVACFAQFQASRSQHNSAKTAALALRNEERLKYSWDIAAESEGDRYVLRNMGTQTAHDVRFINLPPRSLIAWEDHESEQGPTIPRGHAVAFRAPQTFRKAVSTIEFDWLPEGEQNRQIHKDVLPRKSGKNPFADLAARNRESSSETMKETADANRQWSVEARRHLIDLASAWADYQSEATPQNKMRVQALVSALPSSMVREMGHAVDVPRDFWGPNQYPLEDFVQGADDKRLIRDNAAVIELMWNLRWVQIPQFTGHSDLSQNPDPWHRIEQAVYGFRELVRNREQGKLELRLGPRDREHHERAQQMFAQHRGALDKSEQQVGPNRSPGSSGN